jgi:hypothetical protein
MRCRTPAAAAVATVAWISKTAPAAAGKARTKHHQTPCEPCSTPAAAVTWGSVMSARSHQQQQAAHIHSTRHWMFNVTEHSEWFLAHLPGLLTGTCPSQAAPVHPYTQKPHLVIKPHIVIKRHCKVYISSANVVSPAGCADWNMTQSGCTSAASNTHLTLCPL